MVIYMDRFGKPRLLTLSQGRRRELAPASHHRPSGAVGATDIGSSGGPEPRLPDPFEGVDPGGLMERVRALASQI
jgi:hypothetical protein